MNRRIAIAMVLALVLPTPLWAQSDAWSIGASADYLLPIGGLSDRFLPTVGGTLQIGFPTGTSARWSALFEYAKFDRLNDDALVIRQTVKVAGQEQILEFPLEGLDMTLEFIGASADVRFRIIDAEFLRAEIGLAFGMFRWSGIRGAYSDSLLADTTGMGTQDLIAVVNVPSLSQQDWSGGFSAGVEVEVPVVMPVTVWAGARFKLIAGELWPSLDLDLENVSAFQMIDVRLGLRVDL
jgi:hypothetical protein